MGLDWTQICFAACLMVNMVDVMGTLFTAPVLVPYGQQLGATTGEIASFSTVRFGLAIISLLWMPRLADAKGTKVTLLVSVLGSVVAYGIQGNSHYLSGCERQSYTLNMGDTLQLWEGHDCSLINGTVTIPSDSSMAQAVGTGGIVECTTQCSNKNGVYFFMVGRALAGFFGGTQPILRSYISQISLPNMAVLKVRMTFLFASHQAGAFALSPIAGVISQFGLFWPWYVSAGCGVLIFAFVAAFFMNVEEIKKCLHSPVPSTEGDEKGETTNESATESEGEKKVQESTSTAYEGPPPTKDKILWFLLFGYFCIFLTVSALMLLLPLLLEYESYGLLDPNDVERSRERLASATSMVMIPNGVSNLVFSTVGFLIISNFIGDVKTMRLGAFIASVMLCLYGFVATEVWHLLILHGSMGIGLGLFVPALGPTLQRYSTLAHPKKAAQASALPLFGMQLGQVVGQPIFGAIVGDSQDRNRMNIAWLVAGICFALGAVTMDLSMILIHRHPVMKRLKYSPEQVKIMIETGAKEQEVFVEDMCKKLRGMLTEGHPDFRGARLWSGVAQRFIERVIDRSIPKLREGPEEHLEDVALWLSKVGDEKEMEWFRKRFPHVRLPQIADSATESTSFPSSPAPKDYS